MSMLKSIVLPESQTDFQPIGMTSSKFAKFQSHFVLDGKADPDGNTLAFLVPRMEGCVGQTFGGTYSASLGSLGSAFVWTNTFSIYVDQDKTGYPSTILRTLQGHALFPDIVDVQSTAAAGRRFAYRYTPQSNVTANELRLRMNTVGGLNKTLLVTAFVCTTAGVVVQTVSDYLDASGNLTLTFANPQVAATDYMIGWYFNSDIEQSASINVSMYLQSTAVIMTLPNHWSHVVTTSIPECVMSSRYQIVGSSLRAHCTASDLYNGGDAISTLAEPQLPTYSPASTSLYQALSLSPKDYVTNNAKYGGYISTRFESLEDAAPTKYSDVHTNSRVGYIFMKGLVPEYSFQLYFHANVCHWGMSQSYDWEYIKFSPNHDLVLSLASSICCASENNKHLERIKKGLKAAGDYLWKHRSQIAGLAGKLASLII